MKKTTNNHVNEELFGRTKAAKAAWDAFSKAPGSKIKAAKTAYQQRRSYSQVTDLLPSILKQWNQIAGLNPAGNTPANLKLFLTKKSQEIAGQNVNIPDPKSAKVTAAMDPVSVQNYISKAIGLSLQAKALNLPADDGVVAPAAATQTVASVAPTSSAATSAPAPAASSPVNVLLKSGYKDLNRMYQELISKNQRPSNKTKALLNKIAVMEGRLKDFEYKLFQESVNKVGKIYVKNK